MTFTRKCFVEIEEEKGIDYTNTLLSKYSFYSREIYTFYKKTKRAPTQKEIASYLKKSEQSVSRTLKEFLDKIKG